MKEVDPGSGVDFSKFIRHKKPYGRDIRFYLTFRRHPYLHKLRREQLQLLDLIVVVNRISERQVILHEIYRV